MLALTIVCILIGAVLGLRFTVWILVPGFAFGLFAAAAAGVAHRHALGTIGLTMVLIVVGLQFGYLAGTATRFILITARTPGGPVRTASRPAH
jgi:hypothetical protein